MSTALLILAGLLALAGAVGVGLYRLWRGAVDAREVSARAEVAAVIRLGERERDLDRLRAELLAERAEVARVRGMLGEAAACEVREAARAVAAQPEAEADPVPVDAFARLIRGE